MTSGVLTATANIAMATGDLDGARRAAERSVACVADVEGGHLAAMARVRLAVTLRELGASAADTEELVAAAGGWELPLIPPTWRVGYNEAITRVELDGGRVDQAAACAESAEADAAELGLPLATAVAQRARARVQLARGQAVAAAELALASAAGAEATGAPVEAARSRLLAGTAWPPPGTAMAPSRCSAGAEHDLDERGALRDRGEARRQMRQLGARTEPRGPSGAAGGGIESLSRREHEVAKIGHRAQDEQGGRGRAVPQREDGRVAPAQHLRQARRILASGRRPRGRAQHQLLVANATGRLAARSPCTISRAPRPRVRKLIAQLVTTSSRFWKPIR